MGKYDFKEKILKQKIRDFVRTELDARKKKVDLKDQTPLITSGLLDSLFIVDFILFLEELDPNHKLDLTSMKRENLDTLEKIFLAVEI